VLIGESNHGTSNLTDRFLAVVDGDAAAARITEPCSSATSGTRAANHDIGFDQKALSSAGLEKVSMRYALTPINVSPLHLKHAITF
jgi:hypothetical protein